MALDIWQRLIQSPTTPLSMSPIPMPIFSMSERKITVKSGQKLKEVTHTGLVNTMG